MTNIDKWLTGTIKEASKMLQLALVHAFDAEPTDQGSS